MAARGGRMRAGVLLNGLIARVIEVEAVGRVGSFPWRDGGIEFDSERLQPGEQRSALIAEAAQGRVSDRVGDLMPQIFVHRVGRVVVAGRLLLGRAAARVNDAAA